MAWNKKQSDQTYLHPFHGAVYVNKSFFYKPTGIRIYGGKFESWDCLSRLFFTWFLHGHPATALIFHVLSYLQTVFPCVLFFWKLRLHHLDLSSKLRKLVPVKPVIQIYTIHLLILMVSNMSITASKTRHPIIHFRLMFHYQEGWSALYQWYDRHYIFKGERRMCGLAKVLS